MIPSTYSLLARKYHQVLFEELALFGSQIIVTYCICFLQVHVEHLMDMLNFQGTGVVDCALAGLYRADIRRGAVLSGGSDSSLGFIFT